MRAEIAKRRAEPVKETVDDDPKTQALRAKAIELVGNCRAYVDKEVHETITSMLEPIYEELGEPSGACHQAPALPFFVSPLRLARTVRFA